jgi:ABC-type Zn uptake system ZnuABC Zn-binding protein ZnuA
MSKANVETLNMLHDLVANYYVSRVQSGEISPSELSAINKFLKDNEITADLVESKPMMSLVQELKENSEVFQ